MITTEEIAQKIEESLNTKAEELQADFKFRIYDNVGNCEKDNREELTNPQKVAKTKYINGIVTDLQSTITALANINSYVLQEYLTIMAPVTQEQGLDSIEPVKSVVNAWVEAVKGNIGKVRETAYIVAPQLAQTGMLSNDFGFEFIPLTIMLTLSCVDNGVLSNEIKVEIDGQQAMLLNGGIIRTRIADTNNVGNNDDMTSTILQNGFTIKVALPFINKPLEDGTNTTAYKLFDNLLNSDLSTFYTVKISGEGLPTFEKKMVATEITTEFPIGTIMALTATFIIASDLYQ